MLKYILVLVLSVGFMTTAFAEEEPEGPVEVGSMCVEHPDCRDEGERRCLRCDIDVDDDETFGYCECRPGLVHDNRGQCISTRIESRCSDLRGKERAACNKRQQELCDCAVDKGCVGGEDDDDDVEPEV